MFLNCPAFSLKYGSMRLEDLLKEALNLGIVCLALTKVRSSLSTPRVVAATWRTSREVDKEAVGGIDEIAPDLGGVGRERNVQGAWMNA